MTSVLHLTDDTENQIIYNSSFATCNKGQGFNWYSQKQQLVEDRAALWGGERSLAGGTSAVPTAVRLSPCPRPCPAHRRGPCPTALTGRAPATPRSDGRVRPGCPASTPRLPDHRELSWRPSSHRFPSQFITDSSITSNSLLPSSRYLRN